MLTDAQKKAVVEQDKGAKAAYLAAAPKISNAAVKNHDKYKAYEASIGSHHWEIVWLKSRVHAAFKPHHIAKRYLNSCHL